MAESPAGNVPRSARIHKTLGAPVCECIKRGPGEVPHPGLDVAADGFGLVRNRIKRKRS
jgi:hypothetical protein